MTNGEAVNWLINIMADIGKTEHRDLWHYEQALSEIRAMLEAQPNLQPTCNQLATDCIRRQTAIDALMEQFKRNTTIAIRAKLTVEAVPSVQPDIIRCKDCKYMTEYYDTDGNAPYWTCSEWDSGTDYDGFCHYAKRRNDEQIR